MNRSELIDKHIEDIEANSSEIDVIIGLLDSDVARLYCVHRKKPTTFGNLVMQMIETEVNKEAVYRAEQELEE